MAKRRHRPGRPTVSDGQSPPREAPSAASQTTSTPPAPPWRNRTLLGVSIVLYAGWFAFLVYASLGRW
ncbi:MAG: hypothetical protein ACC628_03665 [Pirellulaceae bacterium]